MSKDAVVATFMILIPYYVHSYTHPCQLCVSMKFHSITARCHKYTEGIALGTVSFCTDITICDWI